MDDCMGNFGFYSNKAGILTDFESNINHIHRLQLSWNLWKSPQFLAIVLVLKGPSTTVLVLDEGQTPQLD